MTAAAAAGAGTHCLPYAVDREIEDIDALIDHAGGSAFLYGHSSGGTLAMQAAVRLGGRVSKIAMYEPPHNDDPDAQESWRQYLRELGQVLADGRRGDAVALFMRLVGTPDDQVEGMRQAPFWPPAAARGAGGRGDLAPRPSGAVRRAQFFWPGCSHARLNVSRCSRPATSPRSTTRRPPGLPTPVP